MFIRDSNGINKRLIVVTDNEIKSVSLNFCELRHKSCEQCVKNNKDSIYSTFCYWYNNTCVSETQLDDRKPSIVTLELCFGKLDNINKDMNVINSLINNSTDNHSSKLFDWNNLVY